MKKICVSAGLVALGATVAHGQYAPGLTSQEASKPWSLSATIRGFYDDNYLTLPKYIPGPNGTIVQGARDSYGTEVTPSISYNRSLSDTLINAKYTYDLQWYQDRGGTTDQTHEFDAKVDHQFSQRYKLTLNESFVVAQEPTVLDQAVITTPLRVSGSNIRNTAMADFTARLTKLLDVHLGYVNTYYAFQENAGDEAPANSYPSYSALLDRMDQTGAVDLRWKRWQETTAVLGYQFEDLVYTSPEDIIFSPSGPSGSLASLYGPGHAVSSVRNSESDFVYVGVDQAFSPNLNGSIRVGAEYVDYYNYGTTDLSPYVDASMTYQYMSQSTLQVGIRHIHNATDVAGAVGTTPVLDEETTAAYVSVSHRMNQRFTVAVLGQAQFSTFNGGGYPINGSGEDFYIVNLNLAYHFSPWLTGETGYNYSRLLSSLPDRAYTRDIVYIGIRATY